mgnify:CR=1 FL=1
MTVRLGIVSAKGSPGATTAALAIAAVTGGVMVELDPAGGEVECWAGPCGEPGLIRVAAGLRHAADPHGLIDDCSREVRPGVRAVLAPVGGEQASSTLVAIGDRLGGALAVQSGWVVLDGGRWSRTQPSAGRLAGCDLIAVAVSPTLAGVAHAAPLVRSLRERSDVPVAALVIGERGYPTAELADALDVPLQGVFVRSVGNGRSVNRTPVAVAIGMGWSAPNVMLSLDVWARKSILESPGTVVL